MHRTKLQPAALAVSVHKRLRHDMIQWLWTRHHTSRRHPGRPAVMVTPSVHSVTEKTTNENQLKMN